MTDKPQPCERVGCENVGLRAYQTSSGGKHSRHNKVLVYCDEHMPMMLEEYWRSFIRHG